MEFTRYSQVPANVVEETKPERGTTSVEDEDQAFPSKPKTPGFPGGFSGRADG